MKIENGTLKTMLMSIVFVCLTVLLALRVDTTAIASFSSIATLTIYCIFHVDGNGHSSTLPPSPPAPGGTPHA
jgi:hypothetical protein